MQDAAALRVAVWDLTSNATGDTSVTRDLMLRQGSAGKAVPHDSDIITPDMLALGAFDQEQIDRIVQAVPGGVRNIQDIYPLSPLQEGLLFHYLLSEGTDTYVMSSLFEFSSRQQIDAWARALQLVIDRHDILRTAVLWEDLTAPVQVVCRSVTLSLQQVWPEQAGSLIEQLKRLMTPGQQRMDLRRAPLVRLIAASDERSGQHFALLQLHHMVCDHQSLKTVLSESLECLLGRVNTLSPPAVYREYVAQSLANARCVEAEAYFRETLGDLHEPTVLFGLQDTHGDGRQLKEAKETLGPALSERIRVQAHRAGVSAARMFHAAWALVVARASGRNDVVFGTVLSVPGYSDDANPMLGMAVNTLPLRLRLHDLTVRELLEQTDLALGELRHYAETSLTLAQKCSGLQGAALFNAILNYRHNRVNPREQLASVGIQEIARSDASTNYPVAMQIDARDEDFELVAQTVGNVDPVRLIGYLRQSASSLADALERVPLARALELAILTESERNSVTRQFNRTDASFPRGQMVHEIFEETVARSPHAQALAFYDECLTYEQLNGRANQMAHYLREQGVGPEQIVAICLERGIELIIAILGTWKAGAAYVPLDPAYPHDRIAFMLEDAAPGVMLTRTTLFEMPVEGKRRVIALDRDWEEIAKRPRQDRPRLQTGVDRLCLAYVIYTSGSTGRPKGVMVQHDTLGNLTYTQRRMFELGMHDRVLQFSSLSFDAFVWEIVTALCAGACLCLATRENLAPSEPLLRTFRSMRITFATLPPVAASALGSSEIEQLRTLVVGGEACPAALVARWANRVRFVNAYGPTEATVCSTMHICRLDEEIVPIGRPIDNTRMYVLDPRGEPVPIGVAGELYIGGAGVGRGYLNRPELTAERFIADRFAAEAGGRLYRSGDWVCWREDGTIEYLGRNDGQVKIRGFRIEVGEIESLLMRHPGVAEAIVTPREGPSGKQLVAYFTARQESPELESLRVHLQDALPSFMVPSAFVMLKRWPMTPSGKIDRRALPAPESSAFIRHEYAAPLGEMEVLLAQIWQSVLGVDRIGRYDRFFELGGQSLAAMYVAMRIQAELEMEVPMRLMLDNPSVEHLAAGIEERLRDQLAQAIEHGGDETARLLEKIDALPDRLVDELMRTLSEGASHNETR